MAVLLYVREQTSLQRDVLGAQGPSNGAYGVYIMACQWCTSYNAIPQDSFQPACRIYQSCDIAEITTA